MKKSILALFALSLILFTSCGEQNSPKEKRQITFMVVGFEQITEPLHAPIRRSTSSNEPMLDDEDGVALTDLYVFDGTTELIHQTSEDSHFGQVALELTDGSHSLSFIATRSTGLSYSSGTLAMASIRPTFGKVYNLEVSAVTQSQIVSLNRVTSLLTIKITDAFPNNAYQIEFVMNPKYTDMDITTLCGINGDSWSQKVSCTSKVGLTDTEYKFNLLVPSITEESEVDITLNVYNSSNTRIHSVYIPNVRLAANTKTLLSGHLFDGTGATININTSWNQDIVGSF